MRQSDLLHRQLELVAVSIGGRVQRLHDALEGLAFFTRYMLATTPAAPEDVARWIDGEEFTALETGFFERRAFVERARAAGALPGELMLVWRATLAEHPETRRTFYLMRGLGPHLASLHARTKGVAWVYFQHAAVPNACMVLPAPAPDVLIPSDFDWHSYHSFTIVKPEVNPERAIRWSPPNVDYGGHGLISCVSIPLYEGDTFLGVWTMDVRLSELHRDLALDPASVGQRQTNFLAGHSGRLIAHPTLEVDQAEKGSVHVVRLASLGGDYATLDLPALIARGHGELELTDAEGTRLFVAYRSVPEIGWIVFTTLPRADMVEATSAAFQRAFARLGTGDLSVRLDTVGDEAMGQLAASYNEMAGALEDSMRRRDDAEREKRELALEQERLARELEIAATIQLAMLPRAPRHREFEFAGRMQPAHEVGGDFYDVLANADDRLWLTIGDVSSHGLGAGLVMMIAQAAVQSVFDASPDMPVDEVLRRVNRLVYTSATNRLGGGRYLTGQVLIHRGEGAFDCAGAHLWPLVIDPRTGLARRVEIAGPWLGIVPDLPRVPVTRLELGPGEVMCLYSDGLIEARNAAGEIYDLERLTRKTIDLVTTGQSLDACAAALLADVAAFAPEQDDDRTVLFVRRLPGA